MSKIKLRVSYKELLRKYIGKRHEYPKSKGTIFHITTVRQFNNGTKHPFYVSEYSFIGDNYREGIYCDSSFIDSHDLILNFNEVK